MYNDDINNPEGRLSVEKGLLRLEEILIDPILRKKDNAIENLLSDDFVEFGSSGRIYDKAGVLESLKNESARIMQIRDFRVKPLSEDTMLCLYSIYISDPGGDFYPDSIRSSIWKPEGGKWKMLFHQGTRLARE